MKNDLRKLGALILSGVMVLSMVACSSGTKSGAVKTAEPAKTSGTEVKNPVKLRIAWFGAQYRHDATLKALDAYTKKYPNVTFDPEFVGTNPAYIEKISTQAAAKNLPDILTMDVLWMAEYAGRKQLADLTNSVDISNLDKNISNEGMFNGKLYALPNSTNAIGMVYNKDVMNKLGITLPKNNWTWDDFVKFGKDAQPKLGPKKYALMDLTTDYTIYTVYQYSQGKGDPITADGKINFDKDTWLKYVKMFADLRQAGVATPPEITVTDKDADVAQDMVLNGSSLIKRGFSSTLGAYDSVNKGAYDLVTMPKGVKSGGHVKVSGLWAVSANSKLTDESKNVVNWLVNDLEAGKNLGTVRGFPANKKVNESLLSSYSDADKLGEALVKAVSPDAAPYSIKAQGWSPFYQKDYLDVSQKVIFGKVTPEQGFEEILSKAKDYVK